jgi:hypothetical protein
MRERPTSKNADVKATVRSPLGFASLLASLARRTPLGFASLRASLAVIP